MHHTPPYQAFFVIRMTVAALLVLAAILAFSTAGSTTGHAAVFGVDDRRPLDSTSASLTDKIGTLATRRGGALCTAFCVAPDMIATASHCLFGTAATRGPRLRDLAFKLAAGSAAERSSEIAGSPSATQDQHIIAGTQQLAVSPPISASADWAVAQLETPICKAGGLALTTMPRGAIEEAAARGEIYQVAVHADLPDTQLRMARPCALRTEFPKADRATLARDFTTLSSIFFHTCDTAGGSSGSPLLITTRTGPQVVAMNVGTYVLAQSVPSARTADVDRPQSEAIANTAIAVTAIGEAVARISDGDALTSASDIQRVQALLRDAGFYSGPISGAMTDAARESVSRFNALYGRPVSSRLTPALIADLETWTATLPAQRMMFVPARMAEPHR
ncbi:MAG TPA: trypsin-like peptidase domain-containing protein [Hyphomicrobium sp.]|nr:trypsin-like peptidase domain-containing protein [Hyphomicrobium sp.]